MKNFTDLIIGYPDAENYKRKENKDLFSKVFVQTDEVKNLLDPSKFFLIGDKGTGKTAYAVFLANSEHTNTFSYLKYMRDTEYDKFVKLKKEKQLILSDYVSIWKTLIYVLISQEIKKNESPNMFENKNYRVLDDTYKEFYKSAFSPEISTAFNVIDESKRFAELSFHHSIKVGLEGKHSDSFDGSRFQINLLYIQKKFESALTTLRLKKNHILFIDGIDVRPRNIDYEDYLECVKGLATAIWELNNDFFPTIRDSKRIKVVLLIRPDIFSQVNLHNASNKIKENSVLLQWIINYNDYSTSNIFKVSDKILSSQQEEVLKLGEAWNFYFPFTTESKSKFIKTTQSNVSSEDDSFISFLRNSTFKPRDIIEMMLILQEISKKNQSINQREISFSDFDSQEFKTNYSEYMLGQIKDYLSFYHTIYSFYFVKSNKNLVFEFFNYLVE